MTPEVPAAGSKACSEWWFRRSATRERPQRRSARLLCACLAVTTVLTGACEDGGSYDNGFEPGPVEPTDDGVDGTDDGVDDMDDGVDDGEQDGADEGAAG
jgi:hypothetical protein